MKFLFIAAFLTLTLHSAIAAESPIAKFRFDGRTEASTKKSNGIIMSYLSDRKKAEYLAALVRIQVSDQQKKQKTNPRAKPSPLGPKVNGKTYAEILAYSKKFPNVVRVLRK